MKLYGRRSSVNVQKVLWALAELGIHPDHDDRVGGPFGRGNEAWYLSLNPNGLVPTLVDGDLVLWESNAILRHLARAHDPEHRIAPRGLRAKALADQWIDWTATIISDRAAMPAAYVNLVRTPVERRDRAAVDRAVETMAAAWPRLDAHLARHAHVAGESFSIGDIPAALLADRWLRLDIPRPDTPHIRRWHDALAARSGFAAIVEAPLS